MCVRRCSRCLHVSVAPRLQNRAAVRTTSGRHVVFRCLSCVGVQVVWPPLRRRGWRQETIYSGGPHSTPYSLWMPPNVSPGTKPFEVGVDYFDTKPLVRGEEKRLANMRTTADFATGSCCQGRHRSLPISLPCCCFPPIPEHRYRCPAFVQNVLCRSSIIACGQRNTTGG